MWLSVEMSDLLNFYFWLEFVEYSIDILPWYATS